MTSSGKNPPFCLQHSITCTVVDSQNFSKSFLLVVKKKKSPRSDLYFQMEVSFTMMLPRGGLNRYKCIDYLGLTSFSDCIKHVASKNAYLNLVMWKNP